MPHPHDVSRRQLGEIVRSPFKIPELHEPMAELLLYLVEGRRLLPKYLAGHGQLVVQWQALKAL